MPELFTDPNLRPQNYYRPTRQSGGGFRFMLLAGVAALVLGGGYLYFSMAGTVVINDPAAAVPTIQAEAGALKDRPANPGGVEVLHQNTTIYDRLDKKAAARGKVEQLLPPAETPDAEAVADTAKAREPVAPPPEKPTIVAATTPAPATIPTPAATPQLARAPVASTPVAAAPVVVEPKKPEPVIAAETTVAMTNEPKAVPSLPEEPKAAVTTPSPFVPITPAGVLQPPAKTVAKTVQPVVAPKPVATAKAVPSKDALHQAAEKQPLDVAGILARTSAVPSTHDEVMAEAEAEARAPAAEPDEEAAPPAKPAAAPLAAGQSRVQLASSTDKAAAEKKMFDMIDRHAALLRQTKLTTVRADLGSRGIYYRIQTQPMSAADAAKLCANLKAARLECLLVK